jgi:hypothetical protein
MGWPVRPEAQCPSCGSAERHRLFKLWLDRNSHLLKGKRILHFAPEKMLSPILREYASAYTTTDLAGAADLKLNIESWPAPGSADTELGVLMEREVGHGETDVYAGVQA